MLGFVNAVTGDSIRIQASFCPCSRAAWNWLTLADHKVPLPQLLSCTFRGKPPKPSLGQSLGHACPEQKNLVQESSGKQGSSGCRKAHAEQGLNKKDLKGQSLSYPSAPPSFSSKTFCRPRVSRKHLGVPFIPLCPKDRPGTARRVPCYH